MGKKKTLSINVLLFTISSFGSKLLSFFLVPLYTNSLSTTEYGTIDLIINTALLLMPIFTLTVYDGVMRFTLTEKKNTGYFVAGIKVSIRGSLLLLVIFVCIGLFLKDRISISLLIWVWVIFATNVIYSLLTNYMRAIDKVTTMVKGSLLNSVILLLLNVVLIAVMRLGIIGYFISTVGGLLSSCVYMIIAGKIYKINIATDTSHSKQIMRELLQYSIPLIFTAIAWWINSSLDRYFVAGLLGVEANGIYSVSYKIPSLLTAVQSIFTQAWSISAVEEFNKNDEDGFLGNTFEVFSCVMQIACMGIVLLNIPLSRWLYAKDFFDAWEYVPFLLSATFFGALSGYYGGIFAAVKDTKATAISTVASAVINIVLNYILIKFLCIQGAAIATLFAYLFSWIIRAIAAKKYVTLKIHHFSLLVLYILLMIQVLCAITESHLYIIQGLLLFVTVFIYWGMVKKELINIFDNFKSRIIKNGKR